MIGDEKKCDLNNGELKAVPKGFLMLCPGVESLELQNNELTELPDTLGALANLRTPRLSFNKLTKLPKSVSKGALVSLKGLYLQNNRLTAMGFVKTMPALRKMSIAGNDFMTDKAAKAAVDKELAEANIVVGAAAPSM